MLFYLVWGLLPFMLNSSLGNLHKRLTVYVRRCLRAKQPGLLMNESPTQARTHCPVPYLTNSEEAEGESHLIFI